MNDFMKQRRESMKKLDEDYMHVVADYVEARGKKVVQVTADSVVYKEPHEDGDGYELVEVRSMADAMKKLPIFK